MILHSDSLILCGGCYVCNNLIIMFYSCYNKAYIWLFLGRYYYTFSFVSILLRWWYWCSIHLATHLFFCTLFLADLILYCESYILTILLEANSKEIRKWMTQSTFFSKSFSKLRTESLCFVLLLSISSFIAFASFSSLLWMYFLMIPFWE